mgnify:CR=1 FL=1
MKRFLIYIFAMTLLASCTKGFTTDERKIIYGGEEEIMRVLSIANEQDSLTLRSTSKPLKRDMVSQDEFSTLCRRMLTTVQNPENAEYLSMSRYKSMDTVKKSGRHIDHVFYTPNSVKVLSWKLITDSYDGKFGSDHLPIMADVLIAN